MLDVTVDQINQLTHLGCYETTVFLGNKKILYHYIEDRVLLDVDFSAVLWILHYVDGFDMTTPGLMMHLSNIRIQETRRNRYEED